tara:strand:- start:15385 stop:15804 length:420 start_codon:yes stop_codon:yes gene_type:complete
MMIVALCSVVLALPVRNYDHSMATCIYVGQTAENEGEPEHLMIALSYMESRLTWDAVSHRGARGPMQVMDYWLEDARDEAHAGMIAFRYWRSRSITDRTAIAHYNAGYRPGRRSFAFADRVINLSNRIQARVRGVSNAD